MEHHQQRHANQQEQITRPPTRRHLRHKLDPQPFRNSVAQHLRRYEPRFVADSGEGHPLEGNGRDALAEGVHAGVGAKRGRGPEEHEDGGVAEESGWFHGWDYNSPMASKTSFTIFGWRLLPA